LLLLISISLLHLYYRLLSVFSL